MDKNASERQDPSHDNPRYRLGVDRLVRDLPGDLVGPDWLLYARLPEAKVSSDEGEVLYEGDGVEDGHPVARPALLQIEEAEAVDDADHGIV